MRQSKLQNSQEKFVKKMVDFLEDKPDATINIYPQYFAAKEKEYILFFLVALHILTVPVAGHQKLHHRFQVLLHLLNQNFLY